MPSSPMFSQQRRLSGLLLCSVLVISICSILYELLISSMASYFQGSSVLHFSLVIGLFLSFMGVGSYLSKYIRQHLLDWFIQFEVWLSVVGGFSAFVLYFAFAATVYFYLIAFVLIAILGILIGIEIPVLTRIMRQYDELKNALAHVLSFDYMGALIASLLFPLVLLPYLGTMKTAFVIGLLNLSVAVLNTLVFRKALRRFRALLVGQMLAALALGTGLYFASGIVGYFEQRLYRDQIILSEQSAYQRIVMTRWNADTRLYIDGNLQFSSRDEHRYHEPLVHLPYWAAERVERALVLGGGDGLAVRELLRHPGIQHIEVVDLDPAMTRLALQHPLFTQLNGGALAAPKVLVHNADAYKFVEESSDVYDLVIIDLPDPNNTALGKLYSVEFYQLLKKRLSYGGVVVTQSTSPYYAPDAFWCIHHSMAEVFDWVRPYQAYVPSFGLWGFNMAGQAPLPAAALQAWQGKLEAARLPLRYLNAELLPTLFVFDGDIAERPAQPNRLNDQVLLRYYEQGWKAEN